MKNNSIVHKDDVTQGLRNLGVKKGDTILVHSSLSSFGHVHGGALTVIEALLDSVGAGGTILMPTLTGNELLSPENPPVFDVEHSECWTGKIPQIFRRHPKAQRSLHPTHSVASVGKNTQFLIEDHILSITPCDELSPYGKLATLDNGYILLIGVNHQQNTTIHHVEELVGVDYHIQDSFAKATIILKNKIIKKHFLLHKYGRKRNFNVMDSIFSENYIQSKIMIGNSVIRLIKVKEMVDITMRALRNNKTLLCK